MSPAEVDADDHARGVIGNVLARTRAVAPLCRAERAVLAHDTPPSPQAKRCHTQSGEDSRRICSSSTVIALSGLASFTRSRSSTSSPSARHHQEEYGADVVATAVAPKAGKGVRLGAHLPERGFKLRPRS